MNYQVFQNSICRPLFVLFLLAIVFYVLRFSVSDNHFGIFKFVFLGTDHLTWRGGYGFLFHSEIFFRTTQELEYLFFLLWISFQNITLGYMTKTLNHIIFFFHHQNQNIFFSNIGKQNIFLEKKPSS